MSTALHQLNNRRRGGNGEVQKKRSSRKPFQQLTNTPSKQKSTSSICKPSKPLFRSLSAPVVRAPTPEAEEHIPMQPLAPAQSQFIFRATAISEELDDMWTLKRANPIFEEDDQDDEQMESPSKRTRTTSHFNTFSEARDEQLCERQTLTWNAQIRESDDGFSIVL